MPKGRYGRLSGSTFRLSRFRTYRVGRVRLRSRGRTDRPTGGHQKHGGRTAVHSLSWNRPLCDATITLSGGMGHTPCPSRWPALVPARQAPRPASSPRGGALYRAGKWRAAPESPSARHPDAGARNSAACPGWSSLRSGASEIIQPRNFRCSARPPLKPHRGQRGALALLTVYHRKPPKPDDSSIEQPYRSCRQPLPS